MRVSGNIYLTEQCLPLLHHQAKGYLGSGQAAKEPASLGRVNPWQGHFSQVKNPQLSEGRQSPVWLFSCSVKSPENKHSTVSVLVQKAVHTVSPVMPPNDAAAQGPVQSHRSMKQRPVF